MNSEHVSRDYKIEKNHKPFSALFIKDQIGGIQYSNIRHSILNTLDFLNNGQNSSLSLYDESTNIIKKIIIHSWKKLKAYLIPELYQNYNTDDYNLWDILTLCPDIPLISLFDFNRFVDSFPSNLRETYDPDLRNREIIKLEGSEKPSLWEVLKTITNLQCGFALETFITPIPYQLSKDRFDDLYNFSGNVISELIILTEFYNSIKTERIYNPAYRQTLLEQINLIHNDIYGSNVSFADFFFFHGATWKMWCIINGACNGEPINPYHHIESSHFLLKDKKAFPIIEIFKKLFINNPVTILLMMNFLCDSQLFEFNTDTDDKTNKDDSETENSETENEKNIIIDQTNIPDISKLFSFNICDEVLFWLANYTYSSLMAPFQIEGLSECVFSPTTQDPVSWDDLLTNRLGCICQVINFIYKKTENKEVPDLDKTNIFKFLHVFYTLFLNEWLMETPLELYPIHPIPIMEDIKIPESVRCSYFSFNRSEIAKKANIVDSFKKGDSFSDVAKKYATDHLERFSGGNAGWIKRGEGDHRIEPALFIGNELGKLYYFPSKDKYYFFIVHEEKFSEKTHFLEQLTMMTLVEGGEKIKMACKNLFNPLNKITQYTKFDESFSNWNDAAELQTLQEKAHFYTQMIQFSNKVISRV